MKLRNILIFKKILKLFLIGVFCFFSIIMGNFFYNQYKVSLNKPVLNIYNWQGYIPQSLLYDFEKETGIRVNYSVFENESALESRLFSGMVGFDVVFPSAWPQFARSLDFYQPLNYKKLPNARFLDPLIMKKLENADPKNLHSVPYLWGSTGIGYSKSMIQKNCPDLPVNSWEMFFRVPYIKKLSKCRVSFIDSFLDIFQGALLYLGLDPNSSKDEDWEKAFKIIQKIRPYIAGFGSFHLIKDLVNKDICAMIGFSNEIVMGQKQLHAQSKNSDIVFVLPKEGAKIWIDVMAIPKNALHPKEAHIFINFLLRPRNMAILSNTLCAANPVPKSYQWLDPDLLNNAGIFPPSSVVEKLFTDKVRSAAFYRKLLKLWFRIKMNWREEKKPSKVKKNPK